MPSINGMESFLSEFNGPSQVKAKDRVVAEIPSQFTNQNLFVLQNSERKYDNQFFSLYQYRLKVLKARAMVQGQKKWAHEVIDGNRVLMKQKVLDIRSNDPCWVVGTVFCDYKNKTNIMADVANGIDGTIPIAPKSYSDPVSDIVMLEDESGRVILEGDLLGKTILVTGCIVAVLGMEVQPGMFKIVDICYPDIAPQTPREISPQFEPKKIAIVSGLNISDISVARVKLDLLKQFLSGELGCSDDSEIASSISRLIIAGNSIDTTQKKINSDAPVEYGSKNTLKVDVESIKVLDEFINELSSSLPITIMPGEKDPAEICLPQQPLHRAFFPTSRKFIGSTFESITNPAWFQFEDTRILGTSGQNVDDIFKYLVSLDKLEEGEHHEDLRVNIMEASINWQNVIPTAPDTLHCYPYDDCDPFTLSETPHVYFVGNQPNFKTKLLHLNTKDGEDVNIRLISVPEFSKTGQLILLDITTLESEVVEITI